MLKMFFVNLLFLNATHLRLHQLYITFQLQIKTYPSLSSNHFAGCIQWILEAMWTFSTRSGSMCIA